jgi:hypothetical protein
LSGVFSISLSAAFGSSAAISCARAKIAVGVFASLPDSSFASASRRASGEDVAPCKRPTTFFCLLMNRNARIKTNASSVVRTPRMIMKISEPVLIANAQMTAVMPPIQ